MRGDESIKRLFDLTVAFILLLVFFPLLMLISIMIYLKLGHPVFFVQVRPGLDTKPFRLLKFRTMADVFDVDGHLLPDAERLTTFGRFVRSSSLDEIPELLNVLKGDMSLVGPRPLLMEYLPLYNDDQRRRHEVRPGITGWAQVNGRNSLNWQERFKMDIWYVDNRTLWLDLKILFMTIKKVLSREGVTAEGEATMPKFRGNKS